MSDVKIAGMKTGLELPQTKVNAAGSANGFDTIMQEAIGKISQVQNDAEKAVKELSSGGDVTQAILSLEKADMSFQLMVEVRNKLLTAYEEVMRMQV